MPLPDTYYARDGYIESGVVRRLRFARSRFFLTKRNIFLSVLFCCYTIPDMWTLALLRETIDGANFTIFRISFMKQILN